MTFLPDLSQITIEHTALEMVPTSMAREFLILPVALIRNTLQVVLPADADRNLIAARLEFITNLTVEVDTAEREQLEAAIERYYPRSQDQPPLPETLPDLDPQRDYPFLDLVGNISSSTSASVSFDVGRKSDYTENDQGERTYLGAGRVFHVCGWLDAHYPCQQFHKLKIRSALPDEYLHFEGVHELVACVKRALQLPDHVSWSVAVYSVANSLSMENPQSGLICDTKWIPPEST